jgi:hypothetical protein
MKTLTSAQRDELISQYCELMVDSMDYKSLEQFVYDTMVEFCEKLTDSELKDEIILTNEEELYEELVDNVTNETFLDVNNNGGKF